MSELALDGKVALVTGAQRGIGLAAARELHSRGASVVLTDLDGDATAEAARGIGDRALGIAGDVTDAGAMRGGGRDRGRELRRPRRLRRERGHLRRDGHDRGDTPGGVGARRRGQPARRLPHRPCRAAAACRAPWPRHPRGLDLLLLQRDVRLALRCRQGRGRVVEPLASNRARSSRRLGRGRLLRLHRDRPRARGLRRGSARQPRGDHAHAHLPPAPADPRAGGGRHSSTGSRRGRRGSTRRAGCGATRRSAGSSTRCSTAGSSAIRRCRRWCSRPTSPGGRRAARSSPPGPEDQPPGPGTG